MACLVIVVLAGSTMAPFSLLLKSELAYLNNIWRLVLAFLYILPIALYSGLTTPTFKWSLLLEKRTLLQLSICGITMGAWSSLIMISAEMTVVSHAVLLCNCGCVFIILFMLCLGYKVGKLEIIGCIIAISGCTYSMTDQNSLRADGSAPSLWGDGLAMVSAVFSAIYMMVGQKVNKEIPNIVRTAAV